MICMLRRLVFVLPLFAFTGCSSDGPSSSVSGKVTLDDQPVEAGQVSFISSDGFGATGNIAAGGTFTLDSELPPGTYTVCVSPPALTQAPGGDGTGEVPEESVVAKTPVPKGYFYEGTSDLTQEIQEGDNTVTIALQASGPTAGKAR